MKILKVKDLFSLSLVGATSPFPDWRRPNQKKKKKTRQFEING